MAQSDRPFQLGATSSRIQRSGNIATPESISTLSLSQSLDFETEGLRTLKSRQRALIVKFSLTTTRGKGLLANLRSRAELGLNSNSERFELQREEQYKTMAPGYRANNRRTNRGQVDHDVFEGLPVRSWKRDTVTVAPPPVHEPSTKQDKWDVELPYGMPKDSHLWPEHSQKLLRLARSGRLYQRRPAADEEEADVDVALGDKPEKKENDTKDEGFTVKTWKQIPKHLESAEIEYLAKRRKGLKGAPIKNGVPGPAMTVATVRRTNAEGGTYVEEVVIPEGQSVDGVVISQTVISEATIAGGGDAAAAALRRRPPPPKRKLKGPGRGRKKKALPIPTSTPANPALTTALPTNAIGEVVSSIGADGIKIEAQPELNPTTSQGEDTPMHDADGSQLHTDEEGEDGEDDGSDEDGEEGDDQDQDQDHEMDHENDETPQVAPTPAQLPAHPSLPAKPPATVDAALDTQVKREAATCQESIPHDDEAEADGDDDMDIPQQEESQPAININSEIAGAGHFSPAKAPQPTYFTTEDNEFSKEDSTYDENDDEMLFNNDKFADQPDYDAVDMDAEPQEPREPYNDSIQDRHQENPVEAVLTEMAHQDVPTSTADFIMEVEREQAESVAPLLDNDVPNQAIDAAHDAAEMIVSAVEDDEDNGSFEDLLGSLEDHLNEGEGQPIAEKEPVVEERPVVNEQAIVETGPVVEEKLIIEEEPAMKDELVVEESPVVEEEPAVQEDTAMEEEMALEEDPVPELQSAAGDELVLDEKSNALDSEDMGEVIMDGIDENPQDIAGLNEPSPHKEPAVEEIIEEIIEQRAPLELTPTDEIISVTEVMKTDETPIVAEDELPTPLDSKPLELEPEPVVVVEVIEAIVEEESSGLKQTADKMQDPELILTELVEVIEPEKDVATEEREPAMEIDVPMEAEELEAPAEVVAPSEVEAPTEVETLAAIETPTTETQ